METRIIFRPNKVKLDAVLADKDIPPGAKLILLNLIYRAGRKNYAFPSQKTIGKDTGMGDRQVRNHLNLLKKRGIIEWNRGALNPKTGNRLNSNNYNLSSILWSIET